MTTVTATAASGVATFSGLKIDTAGTYSFSVTDGPLFTSSSNSFTVSPGAATHVAFVQQPTNTLAGAAMSPAVTVQVEDEYNNQEPSNTSSVTITLSSGTFEGGSANVSAVATDGVATFSALKLELPGTYTLSATDGTLAASGPSNSFTITGEPSQLVRAATYERNRRRDAQSCCCSRR